VIVAVDPGDRESAYVRFDAATASVLAFSKLPNEELLALLTEHRENTDQLVLEMIASYGMPVGREVFETCVWIGRFAQAWGGELALVYRRDVKLHLCGSMKAKDGNIRQALIDRWGGKDRAIGRKATPGPLHGISADVWSALAIAVTFADRAHSTEAA
jgi:hypothetical protein